MDAKRARFCREYLVDLNASAAAARAGYSTRNKHSAAVQGHRLLQRPDVQAELARLSKARAAKVDLSAERVLAELMRFAFADLRQAFDEQGRLRPIHELPEDVARAISGVEVEELFEGRGEERAQIGVLRKVKFWDKPRGLELLAKHLGLLVERHEVKVSLTAEQRARRVEELLRKGAGK